jgi:hypothetical protein
VQLLGIPATIMGVSEFTNLRPADVIRTNTLSTVVAEDVASS